MLKEDDPHGTVEELVRVRADLVKIGSCSRKKRDEDNKVSVIGCGVRRDCDLDEKDGKGPPTSGCNGRGPCRKGLEYIKVMPDGKRVVGRVVLDCFHIPGFRRRIETRGHKRRDGTMDYGIVRVIAGEGDEITLPGSHTKDEIVPGEGSRRLVIDEALPQKIEKFPRPGMPGNLPGLGIAAEVMEAVRVERRAGAPARLLGIEDEDEQAET